MVRNERAEIAKLVHGARAGRLTRREVLRRGLMLGLSSPLIMSLLAACGGGGEAPGGEGTAPPGGGAPTTETGGEQPTGDQEFVMAFTGGVPDVDPQSAYDNQASSLFLATYEMLLRLKGEETFEYEPMLADSWEENQDQTEFTFKISEGITFHDGSTCDAEAIKQSLTRFVEMGRGPVNVLSRFVPDPATQIEVVDPTTIKFIMNKPEPLFLAAMASEYGPLVVSPAAMEEHKTADDPYAHQWFSQNMVGTGPYQVTEALPQERFVLDRFPDYHREPPFFDRIIARVVPEDATRRQLIEAGEVNGVAQLPPEDLEALKQDPRVQVVEYETTECDWIRMNYVTIPDSKARQGFAYAFPYDAVINQVLKGFAKVQGPIPDTVIGFDSSIPVYETDLDKAKQLLTEGGVKEGDSFTYMLASGDATDTSIAQLFQANLAELGVSLEIEAVDRAALIDLNYGDAPPEERPHFTSSGWWPDYNDSWNQLYPNFHSDSVGSKGSNSSFYQNKDFDALMDQLEMAETEDEITELTGKVVNILMWEDPGAIFYAQITKATVLSADIKGFIPNGIYINSYNFHQMTRVAT